MGLGGFADGHAHLLRDQVDSFELLSNGWETVDGQRALVRMVRFRVGESEPLVQLQAFTVRDGLGLRHLRHRDGAGLRGSRARVSRGHRRPALRIDRRPGAAPCRCCTGERAQSVR